MSMIETAQQVLTDAPVHKRTWGVRPAGSLVVLGKTVAQPAQALETS